jgi:hypothetical protein
MRKRILKEKGDGSMPKKQGREARTASFSQASSGDRLAVALRTTDLMHLAVVKSLLESAGVYFAVQGEEALRLLPIGGGFFNPNAHAAVLRVRAEDLEEVRKLLDSRTADPGPDE